MALPQRALGMRHAGLATEAAATATAAVRSATGDAVMEVVDLVKEEAASRAGGFGSAAAAARAVK